MKKNQVGFQYGDCDQTGADFKLDVLLYIATPLLQDSKPPGPCNALGQADPLYLKVSYTEYMYL